MKSETCYRASGCQCRTCFNMNLGLPIAMISIPKVEHERLLEKARLWDQLGQPMRDLNKPAQGTDLGDPNAPGCD